MLFRLMMGPFAHILDSRGGKFGPNACLPIEVNGQTCNGALAIGRFAALSCTSIPGTNGAQIYMFKARDQTDPFFGHILCKNCHSSTLTRQTQLLCQVMK